MVFPLSRSVAVIFTLTLSSFPFAAFGMTKERRAWPPLND